MTDEYSGLITQQKKYSKFSDKKHSGVSKLSNAHNDQGEAALLLNKCREIFVMLREKSIKHKILPENIRQDNTAFTDTILELVQKIRGMSSLVLKELDIIQHKNENHNMLDDYVQVVESQNHELIDLREKNHILKEE